MTARGIRLNNPTNLRHSRDKWQGKAAEQPDSEFVAFVSIPYGFRAATRNLLTYESRGTNTVREIIAKWAPSNENDTDKYIADVCKWTGFDQDQILDIDHCATTLPLLKAMARKETGKIFPDSVILDGMRMAGVHDAPPRPVMKQPAGQAATVATIGGAVAGAGEVARQVREVQDTAQVGVDLLQWGIENAVLIALLFVVAGASGVLYALWQKNRAGG